MVKKWLVAMVLCIIFLITNFTTLATNISKELKEINIVNSGTIKGSVYRGLSFVTEDDEEEVFIQLDGAKVTSYDLFPKVLSLSKKSVSGVVYKYPSNKPLKDVEVELRGFFGGFNMKVTTDSDGAFLFEDYLHAPTDIYRLEAFKEGLQCNAIGFYGKDRNHKIDLWLASPGSGKIFGYVRDSSGNAVDNAKVKIEAFFEDTRRTTTSPNGYYEFSNVDIPYVDDGNGKGYRINVTKAGYQSIQKNIIGIGEYGNFIIQKDFSLIEKSKTRLASRNLDKINLILIENKFFDLIDRSIEFNILERSKIR